MNKEELSQAVIEASARVIIDEHSQWDDCRVVKLDGIVVFSGWQVWARAFSERLVVALANGVPDFSAISKTMESMYDDSDGLDPHPAYKPPLQRKGPIHKISHIAWSPKYEMFEFLAKCNACDGTGKDYDNLNCEECNGQGVIEVDGSGRDL